MKKLIGFVLGSAMMIPLFAGCAEHRRAYVYGTYGPSESGYYSSWETETHRQHRDFERRRKAEQRQYWEWRKQHHDRDHDRDHDHDHDHN